MEKLSTLYKITNDGQMGEWRFQNAEDLLFSPPTFMETLPTQHKSALRMSDGLPFWRFGISIGRSSDVLVRPLDVPRHIRVPPHKKSY